MAINVKEIAQQFVGKFRPTLKATATKPTFLRSQEKGIEEQFAGLQTAARARQDELKRQQEMELARAANVSGYGGAEQKMRQEAQLEREKAFGAQEAELGAAKAGALTQVREAERQRQMASEFFYKELEENKRTNLINAMVALKKGGILKANETEWSQYFEQQFGKEFTPLFERWSAWKRG